MRRVARPVHLNKREIAHVVTHDLMPQIVRRAERHPRQDEPLGDTRGWAKAQITVEAADGRDTVTVQIEVESERSRAPRVSVLGGKSRQQHPRSPTAQIRVRKVMRAPGYVPRQQHLRSPTAQIQPRHADGAATATSDNNTRGPPPLKSCHGLSVTCPDIRTRRARGPHVRAVGRRAERVS